MPDARLLTDKKSYQQVASSERSGDSDEKEKDDDGLSEGEKSEAGSQEDSKKSTTRTSESASRISTGHGEGEDEGGESEGPLEDSDEESQHTAGATEITPLIEGEEPESEEEEEEGEDGEKRKKKKKDDEEPPSRFQKITAGVSASTRRFQQQLIKLPWKLICSSFWSGSLCLSVTIWLFLNWCVLTEWGPWEDCQPDLRGAPHCSDGVSKRHRQVVRGNCVGRAKVHRKPCNMGPCVMPDLLARSSQAVTCNSAKRHSLLAAGHKAWYGKVWDALSTCKTAYLCCFACADFYSGSKPMSCNGQTIRPKALYTADGCLSCFATDISTMPQCKGQEYCTEHFSSALGAHSMCCVRMVEAYMLWVPTTTPAPVIKEHFRIDNHNFRRSPDTSAFLGLLHRPFVWPIKKSEAECQRLCWLDAECYLYSYVTQQSHIRRWRGRCVTWNRPTADLYRRSSPTMWIPEKDVMSGFKYAVRFSDIVVTVTTSNKRGSSSGGPFMLYVCRLLKKCQVHSPVKLTGTNCNAEKGCLDRGTTQRFMQVVAIPHTFHMHAVLIESFTDDEWIFDNIAVDIDGQIGSHEGVVSLKAPDQWEFTIGCVTTSGWHVTATPGSVCKTRCFDGYGLDGWCWADDSQTLWGACVPECARIHNEVKTESTSREKSGQSCAELNWPTWSKQNTDHAVCGASNAHPLHGCSGRVSWEAAREFCLAIGARLCTKAELEADEVAGTGCGLDQSPVWSATSCPDGSYVACAGSSKHRHEVPSACTQPAGESASARCCADSRKMVITFSRENRDKHTLPGRLNIRNSGGLANWMVVAGLNYKGEQGFFLQSGMLDDQAPFDGQYLDVTLTEVPIAERGGEIEFYFRINSEERTDQLHFYIDGKEEDRAGFPVSGKIDWRLARFAFPERVDRGLHSFRWRYQKDSSHSYGHDVACIDRIVIFGIIGDE